MPTDQHPRELSLRSAVFSHRPSQPKDFDAPRRPLRPLASVRRHRKLFLSALAICFALSAVVLFLRRGTWYEAKSYVYVSPTRPATLAEDKDQERPYDAFIEDQAQTVKRYDILAAAVQQMRDGVWQKQHESTQSAVARLNKQLEVERVGSTFQLSIALKAHSPEKAAEAVNAVTRSFVERAHEEEFYGQDERLANLRRERNQLQQQLDAALASQAKLMDALGIASVQHETANPYDGQLTKLHEDLSSAREKRMEAEAQLAALKSGGAITALDATAQDAISADAGLTSLKSALNQRRAVLIEQMNGLTPSNPLRQQDQGELATIEQELNQSSTDLTHKAASRIQQKLEAELYRTRTIEMRLQQELFSQTHSAMESVPKFQQAKELSITIERLQAGYAAVDERIRGLELESSSPGSIHLSSPALAPLTPVKSRTWMLAFVLAGGSFLFALLLAVTADLVDPHVYTSADVEMVMGFPPLGVLLDNDEFNPETTTQYLLKLAGSLHHARVSTGARVFLFTGTSAGDGVTTLVEKLARHLRNLSLRTLTLAATNVDGKISYITDLNSRPGSALRVAGQPAETPGSVPDPAASHRNLHTNALALERLAEKTATQPVSSGVFVANILREIKHEHDIVLIDASPVLISADAEYLARIADGAVLVISSGTSTRDQLSRSARLLERLDVAGIGVVLNRVRQSSVDPALAEDIRNFERQLERQRESARSETEAHSPTHGETGTPPPHKAERPASVLDTRATAVAGA